MAVLTSDTSELEKITKLFDRRASDMVKEATAEGHRRADAYKASGGRRRRGGHGSYGVGAAIGRRGRRRASGNQIARMIEKVLYHRFGDFFGNW